MRAKFTQFLTTFLFLGILAIAPLQVNAVSSNASLLGYERILNYDSKITINEDSSIDVVEDITVEAENAEINHGIYRDYPTDYRDSLGFIKTTTFEINQVQRDGRNEPYHTAKVINGTRLFIGDSGRILDPGIYTYKIVYHSQRQLGFYSNHDELFYNVTGNSWLFPIEKASATVYLPDNVQLNDVSILAFTGLQNAKGKDYTFSKNTLNGTAIFSFKTTRQLEENEGFSIVVGWPKGFVSQQANTNGIVQTLLDNYLLIFAFLGMGGILLYYAIAWFVVGRDPSGKTIIPLFTPPAGLTPAAVRYLMHMNFDDEVVSAALIDASVKGKIKILEHDDTYEIQTVGELNYDDLPNEEYVLLTNLLGGSNSIVLENSNYAAINSAKKQLKAALDKKVGQYFIQNSPVFYLGLVFSLIYYGVIILINSLTTTDSQVGGAVFILGFLGVSAYAVFNQSIVSAFKLLKVKLRLKYLMKFLGNGCIFLILMLIIILVWAGLALPEIGLLLSLILIIPGILIFVFRSALRAHTLDGKILVDKVAGFRMFLMATEKERIGIMHKKMNTADIDTYEKYLPYAMALDIEPQWSEQFKDSIAQAAKGQTSGGYVPIWYGAGFNSGSFSGGGFSSALSSSISSSSVSPGSSSGFGGGGGSGGGGGGGGGGGW
jgi:hypothetical protein